VASNVRVNARLTTAVPATAILPAVVQVNAPVGIKVIVPPVVEIGAGAVMVTMAAVPEIMVTGAVGATVAAEAIVPATAVLAIKPIVGVTNVGLVANTKAPDPVSFVTAAAKLADEGVPKKVAMLAPNPLIPVATGKPVQLVKVPEVGVPNAGVVKMLLVNKLVFDNCLVTLPCCTGIKSLADAEAATGSWDMVMFDIFNPSNFQQRC
jgi:hypothetical protein